MDASKKFVTLNTGAKMPTLGMGTWHHGPREEIDAALRFSIKKGYRHIDCAKVYLNEKEVGEVFKDIIDKEVPREELFIIGKVSGFYLQLTTLLYLSFPSFDLRVDSPRHKN